MKLFLILSLLCAVRCAPQYEPVNSYYHQTVGIPAAARIKASEEARDFDGSRIIGGSFSNLGQFPHFGGLLISLNTGVTSVCGSSLLSNTKLVTAAQCWFDGNNHGVHITVVLGSVLLFFGGVRVVTTEVEVHGNYNTFNLNNNIAMVTIPWTPYTVNIYPISLAHGSEQFIGQEGAAVGFGSTNDGSPIGQGQALKHARIPVMVNLECQRVFGGIVTSSTLCVDTSAGGSTCAGDIGGPLKISNRLVGVASFIAAAGCSRGLPAGFSRVTSFATWLHARF